MRPKCEATGKVKFDSMTTAKERMFWFRIAWQIQWHGRRRKHRQGKPAQKRAYYCPYCGSYHLTSWSKYFKKEKTSENSLQQFIIQLL